MKSEYQGELWIIYLEYIYQSLISRASETLIFEAILNPVLCKMENNVCANASFLT